MASFCFKFVFLLQPVCGTCKGNHMGCKLPSPPEEYVMIQVRAENKQFHGGANGRRNDQIEKGMLKSQTAAILRKSRQQALQTSTWRGDVKSLAKDKNVSTGASKVLAESHNRTKTTRRTSYLNEQDDLSRLRKTINCLDTLLKFGSVPFVIDCEVTVAARRIAYTAMSLALLGFICFVGRSGDPSRKRNDNAQDEHCLEQVSPLKRVTLKELEKHNHASSLWMAINGSVCDLTSFAAVHPGGITTLVQHAGKEADEAFEEVGHSSAARMLVQKHKVGVLEGTSGRRTINHQQPSTGRFMGGMFTHEDRFQVHKVLGVFCLGSYVYRTSLVFYNGCTKYDIYGFGPDLMSLITLLAHMALSLSSLIFNVPQERVKEKPMIWAEFRLHNIVFATRHAVVGILIWMRLRWDLSVFALILPQFAVVFGALLLADLITDQYRADKLESTTATMPYWDGCPLWVERVFKEWYAIAQFMATAICLNGFELGSIYLTMFPIQFASFLMTLVRKNVISNRMYHLVYFWSLAQVAVVYCATLPDHIHAHLINGLELVPSMLVNVYAQVSLGISVFVLVVVSMLLFPYMYFVFKSFLVARRWGMPKFLLWSLVFAGDKLLNIWCKGWEAQDCLKLFAVVALPTAVLSLVATLRSRMKTHGESTLRRFIEFRPKSMKLMERKKVADNLFLLRFELPPGYCSGVTVGQHVRLHCNPDSEHAVSTFRSYTPISALSSSTLDLVVRHYPPQVDKGYPHGGQVSRFLVEQIVPGETASISGPYGHKFYEGKGIFDVDGRPMQPRVMAALVAGSGVTPLLAIINHMKEECRDDEHVRSHLPEVIAIHVNHTNASALPLSWYHLDHANGLEADLAVKIHNVETVNAGPPNERKQWLREAIVANFPKPDSDVLVLICGPQSFVDRCCRPVLCDVGYTCIASMW